MNDLQENSRLGLLCDSKEDEDEHLCHLVSNKLVNPNDYTQGTSKSCRSNIRNLMKARNNVLDAKKVSGTHQPDTWHHPNSKFLTVGKANTLPDWPVHHLDIMCNKHPAINSACAAHFKDGMLSSSVEAPLERDERPHKKGNLMKVIKQATLWMDQSQNDAKVQHEELISFQRKTHEIEQRKEKSAQWEKCMHLARAIRQMADEVNERMNHC
jgi:hypothetical protein